MLDNAIIRLNSLLTTIRRTNMPAENVLLLLPHCLQWSECSKKIAGNSDECIRCGNCPMAEVLRIADKYECPRYVAKGGREATEQVRQPHVKVVVAVACEKELSAGIISAFPKPVVAVCNSRPCGFCNNTAVDPYEIEATLQRVVSTERPS